MTKFVLIGVLVALGACVPNSGPHPTLPAEAGPAIMIFRSVQQSGEPVTYNSPVPVPLNDHLAAFDVIRSSGGQVRYADSSMAGGFLIPLCAQYCRQLGGAILKAVRDEQLSDTHALVDLSVTNGRRCIKKITYFKRSDTRWQTAVQTTKEANSGTNDSSQLAWCS